MTIHYIHQLFNDEKIILEDIERRETSNILLNFLFELKPTENRRLFYYLPLNDTERDSIEFAPMKKIYNSSYSVFGVEKQVEKKVNQKLETRKHWLEKMQSFKDCSSSSKQLQIFNSKNTIIFLLC